MKPEGQLVAVSSLDTLRIEILGGGALQVPAVLVVKLDRVWKHCWAQGKALHLQKRAEDCWEASVEGCRTGTGVTPWGAIVALSEGL